MSVKTACLRQARRARPADAVLASSTSAILPSRFTEALTGRARSLVVHPINPPYLIPAVEIVPAPWTDAAVVERTAALMRCGRPRADRDEARDRRLRDEPHARRAAARRRSGSSPKATRASRTSTSAFATGWRCAGRSSARSRPSTSTRRAECATMPARYQGIYEADLPPRRQWRADWSGPVMDAVEARAAQASAGGSAGGASGLARPAADGARRAQGARRQGHRRVSAGRRRPIAEALRAWCNHLDP